jgi:hypothetical protein
MYTLRQRLADFAARHPRRAKALLAGSVALVFLFVAASVIWIVSIRNNQANQDVSHILKGKQDQPSNNNQIPTGNFPYVSGTKLYDGQGKTLLLRGAMLESSFAYINDYTSKHTNPLTVLNSKTFQAMRSWGMNNVRINISQWIQQADTSNQYLSRLDSAIADANQSGLYVILDFHNDKQSGASGQYTDDKLHKTSEDWWVSIATRYKDSPMVLFDLANEPHYTSWSFWEHGDGKDIVGLLDVGQAIRQAGAQNILVLEPGDAAGPKHKGWYGLDPSAITDKNTIISKHDYAEIPEGYSNSSPASFWNQDWGPFLGVRPLYYGEWAVLPHADHTGFCQGITSSNADAVTNTFLNYMQSASINWSAWSFTPTHMIDSWANLQPTSMQTGAPWTCPVTQGPALRAGMGLDIKNFLQAHP